MLQRESFYLKQLFLCIFLLCCICIAPSVQAQEVTVDFDSERWEMSNAQKADFLGRPALMGVAYLNDVDFENGVIEVDIAVVEGSRSYPGIMFRAESLDNCERFYVRPHRAPFYPDALQYTPVINGIGSWQLYSGEGYTAAARIPANQWLHLKAEISGKQAKFYFNDDTKPALVVHDLKTNIQKGKIGVFGMADGTSYFSNFKYRLDPELKFEPAPVIEAPPGSITDWEISQPFKISEVKLDHFPGKSFLEKIAWQKVKTEPNGMVDVSRSYGMGGREPICIYARTWIDSEEDQIKQFDFGYSDLLSIFMNGQIHFMGNSAYQSRDPSFTGIIGYFDSIFLPLKKGRNELVFLVAEAFGGWGFMCKESNAVFEHVSMTKRWEVEKDLRMPESALYDRKRNVIYVSNFDPYGTPGQQFISTITPDGAIKDLKFVEGLMMPTGMVIHNDHLFVVERRAVAEIDLETGIVANRLPVPQALMLNDIAVDREGHLYISDSRKGAIYRSANGSFEEWFAGDAIGDANGLLVVKDELFVGSSANHSIVAVNLNDKKQRTVVRFADGIMDGIKVDGKGNIFVSLYQGRLYMIAPAGEQVKLLDLSQSRCADFDFVPETNLFIIPTLEYNTIMAYQIKLE